MVNPGYSFEKQFYETREELPGKGLDWVNSYRISGIETFSATGFPNPSWEYWKYTKLPRIESDSFRRMKDSDANKKVDTKASLLPAAHLVSSLVFVNGFFREDLSTLDKLPAEVIIETMAEAFNNQPEILREYLSDVPDKKKSPLVALNAAFMETGVVVRVRSGARISLPIEIIYINGLTESPVIRHPRNLIILEEGAQVSLIKQHLGLPAGEYFTNGVTDITLGKGAELFYYAIQRENRDSVHLSTTNVCLNSEASFESFSLAIGGRISRSETNVKLNGSGSNCNVSGSFLMRGREHCDFTTVIEHVAPDTKSRQVFKGILDDDSRGVFQGRVIVHKDAQKTDGHQLCKTLLLSNNSEMDAKPELEIYADDVKCSHGATTGQIDETSLFYMRSRGIPEALARNLLIQSFIGEGLEEISETGVKEAVMDHVLHWLPAHCYLSQEWRTE